MTIFELGDVAKEVAFSLHRLVQELESLEGKDLAAAKEDIATYQHVVHEGGQLIDYLQKLSERLKSHGRKKQFGAESMNNDKVEKVIDKLLVVKPVTEAEPEQPEDITFSSGPYNVIISFVWNENEYYQAFVEVRKGKYSTVATASWNYLSSEGDFSDYDYHEPISDEDHKKLVNAILKYQDEVDEIENGTTE